ncbi:hypothetical protein [Paenibacillus tyrfis]|uniref:Uncharacterized protein n=1 Tax=Paenibacillus tyrfis TaxID=1501230 RepID=A0A081NWQ0_9BACL|nr:hypothetical protein [Paenibacillus tyrfis]KEQ22873.1 hypothetical protein ET33_21245 [Paenibacillus tyrfis]
MTRFRFASTLARYATGYAVVRTGSGKWDEDGVYQPAQPERVQYRGVIQPIGIKLMQLEGGRYTMDDRILYTIATHQEGDRIECAGHYYTIDSAEPREYSDAQKYTMKRVSTHDSV